MTDLSGFSNDSFKSSSWINAAIKDRPEEETLESYLASLAMKLHIVSQDYTDQLETGRPRFSMINISSITFIVK